MKLTSSLISVGDTYTLDWKDEQAVKCLTQATMIVNYKLRSYDLPSNYLVPRVPQREAYIDWINNLFTTTESEVKSGFDIGVGANCIYPIIGTLKYKWNMSGSEIN